MNIRETEEFWRERCSSLSDEDGALELARSLREISVEIGHAIAKAPEHEFRPLRASSLAVYAGTLKAAADALEGKAVREEV
jgi:hypothetical protein